MTDRELLELAAKAAGLEVFEDSFHDGDICYYADDIDCNIPWNPLTDDGDALRLAVKLGYPHLISIGLLHAEQGEYEQDPYAATRRAIVRAAAEIGNEMNKEQGETK